MFRLFSALIVLVGTFALAGCHTTSNTAAPQPAEPVQTMSVDKAACCKHACRRDSACHHECKKRHITCHKKKHQTAMTNTTTTTTTTQETQTTQGQAATQPAAQ